MLERREAQKFRRINVVVHQSGIVASGDVVESQPQSELVASQAKAVLQMRVQSKEIRKAALVGRADQLLAVVNHAKGESGAVVERIGKIQFVGDGQETPRDKPVGRIPIQGAARLLREQGIDQAEVQHRGGPRQSARI